MSKKKGAASSRNGRDSNAQRLGVKRYSGETVTAGTIVVQRLVPEADGPCRDVNYDPVVLPDGLSTGDDPFPAARSAAYAVSYDRRTAEAAQYPRQPSAR